MKKAQKLFLLAGVTSILAFNACKKDDTSTTTTVDDVKLTVTVNPTGITSFPKGNGVTIHAVAKGNANNKLKSLKISWTITVGTAVPVTKDTTIALSDTTYDGTFPLSFNTNNTTYSVSATLNGATGSTISAGPFTFVTNTIDSSIAFLGNQADANPKFWSAKMKGTYFLADISSGKAKSYDMDFGYCSRSTANGGNKIIAPSSDDATAIYDQQWSAATEKISTWGTRNSTGFIKVNSKLNTSAFNNYGLDTDSLITVAKTVGEPSNPSVPVADGDIILFRNVRGTPANPIYFHGLILVTAPTGSVNTSGTALPGNTVLFMRYQREK